MGNLPLGSLAYSSSRNQLVSQRKPKSVNRDSAWSAFMLLFACLVWNNHLSYVFSFQTVGEENWRATGKLKFSWEMAINGVTCIDEHSKRHKRNMIVKALNATPPDMATLRQLAISRGGLIDDSLRKRAWPCLLDIDLQSISPKPGEDILCVISAFFLMMLVIARKDIELV